MKLALAAGEHSGDRLAAAVLESMTAQTASLEAIGLAGPAMQKAGVVALADLDEINVMGLVEVLRHVPRLARLRRRLAAEIRAFRPSLFVGFDAPDFNLGLARRLRGFGIPTVQVVAPSVWAWRRYRIPRIVRSVDALLTLFPFEPAAFEGHGLDVRFIGHPLADAMPLNPDREAARRSLGIETDLPVIALLPGSRPGELLRHARLIIETLNVLRRDRALKPVLLLAAAGDLPRFVEAAGVSPEEMDVEVVIDQTRVGLTAADVALAASGTVTLEALLARTPMVVYYRLAGSTYALARMLRLVRSRWVSLPNVLAGETLVPERIQHAATPVRLAADLAEWLDNDTARAHFDRQADRVHEVLACGAAVRAAEVLGELAS